MNPVLKVIKYEDITDNILYIPFRQKCVQEHTYLRCLSCRQDVFYFSRDYLNNKLSTHCYFCDYSFLCIDPSEPITRSFLKDKNSRVYEVCNTIYLHLLKFVEI